MTDCSRELVDAVAAAKAAATPLYIQGGGSKRLSLGRDCDALPLDVSRHRGVVNYQPGELVITVRAGTPVTEVQQALAEQGQTLAFEPPQFEQRATIGGTLATNLSGPARPWAGAARDFVLGVQLINGRAELLNFGGQVMKNVAGYDVSRLQAGALGTLGVISEVSLKVLPQPEYSLTLGLELDAERAIVEMNRRGTEPKPLTGACWVDGRLFLRLSGAAVSVKHTVELWGGEKVEDEDAPWRGLGEMSLPFFAGDAPLWRISQRSTAPLDTRFGDCLLDWCGAQRWVRGDHSLAEIHRAATGAGGHATLFRGGDRKGEVRHPLPAAQQRLQLRLKQALDPDGLFNPGRLYSWM